jgi:hypothetical protein
MTDKTPVPDDTEGAKPEEAEADQYAGYADDNESVPDDEAETPEAETEEPAPETPDWEARFRALETQLAESRAQPATPSSAAQEPAEDEDWESLRQDYPDIAEPIQKLLERQQQQFGTALAEVRALAFEESMDAARPDWRTLRQDRDFAAWIQANPQQQQAAQQPGVRAALGVIQAYDDHRKAAQVQAQREARLKAAQATPAKGSRAPSLSDALDGWAAD